MDKKSTNFASSQVPLYYQVQNVLREQIASGKYKPGEKLPTENEMIEQFGVSRMTVRQALAKLAAQNLIESRRGSGSYVAKRKTRKRHFDGTIHLTGSLDELIEMGLDTPVKLLEFNHIEADEHEAEFLKVKKGTPIYLLKRLRLHEGKPYSLIVNYLPDFIGEKLTDEELNSGTILQTIETKLGFRLHDARQQIKAELADPYVANLLEIPIGSPLLSIERSVYTVEGKPVEFVHTLYRSDIYGFSVYLKRDNEPRIKEK